MPGFMNRLTPSKPPGCGSRRRDFLGSRSRLTVPLTGARQRRIGAEESRRNPDAASVLRTDAAVSARRENGPNHNSSREGVC
jgi:hypothetical protein